MQIFQSMTEPAQQKLKEATDPATIQAGTAAMNEAVEQALGMMQTMAEAARTANEQAFDAVKDQVASATKSGGS